jgi:hypothetical protein
MTTTARILKPFLADFAKELLADGFKVYLFTSDIQRVAKGGMEQVGTWFGFSREVEGIECFASVSEDFFQTVKFSMPIKPSAKNGSSMWLGNAQTLRSMETYGSASEAKTVENARLYASPTGYNPLVGIQQNRGAESFARIAVEVTE